MKRLAIIMTALGLTGHCLSAEAPFGLGGTVLRSEPDGHPIAFDQLPAQAQATIIWTDQFDFPYRNTRHIPISSIVNYIDRVTHIGPRDRLELEMRFDEKEPAWASSIAIPDVPLRMGLPEYHTILRMWLIMSHVLKSKVGITADGRLFLFNSRSVHEGYVPVASVTIGTGLKELPNQLPSEEEVAALKEQEPIEVSWGAARRLILDGDVVECFQAHSRHVTLKSKRGVVYHTVEPRLDLVLHVINQVDPQRLFINVGME